MFKRVFVVLLCILIMGSFLPVSALEAAGSVDFGEKQSTVHIIGDSTACDYMPRYYPRMGWGQVFDRLLDESVAVNNMAVSGASARSFYNNNHNNTSLQYSWDRLLPQINEGDYLIIQFGHNDAANDNRYSDPSQGADYAQPEGDVYNPLDKLGGGSFKWYLAQFLEGAIEKGAMPILVTSTETRARNGIALNFPPDRTLLQYVNAAKSLSEEHSVPCIDVNTAAEQLIKEYGAEGSKKLFMVFEGGEYFNYPTGSEDNIHLQEYGAVEMARLLASGLLKSESSLKNYIVNMSKPAFYNADYHAISAKEAGDNVKIRMQIANNGNSEKLYQTISAVYGTDGKLEHLKINDIQSVPANSMVSIENEIAISNFEQSVKLFVWNGINLMRSYAERRSFEINQFELNGGKWLVNESFDSYEAGTAVHKMNLLWTTPTYNQGTGTHPVFIARNISGFEGGCIFFPNYNGGGSSSNTQIRSATSYFSETLPLGENAPAGELTIEADIMFVDNKGRTRTFVLSLFNNTSGVVDQIRSSANWTHMASSEIISPVLFGSGSVNKLKYVIDTKTKKIKLYFNDELKLENLNFQSDSDHIAAINFQCAVNVIYDAYLDNVKAYFVPTPYNG